MPPSLGSRRPRLERDIVEAVRLPVESGSASVWQACSGSACCAHGSRREPLPGRIHQLHPAKAASTQRGVAADRAGRGPSRPRRGRGGGDSPRSSSSRSESRGCGGGRTGGARSGGGGRLPPALQLSATQAELEARAREADARAPPDWLARLAEQQQDRAARRAAGERAARERGLRDELSAAQDMARAVRSGGSSADEGDEVTADEDEEGGGPTKACPHRRGGLLASEWQAKVGALQDR